MTRPAGVRVRIVSSAVLLPALMLGFALLYGTVGFVVIEGFGLLDSLYMTVTTLTTVGFGEIEPLGPGGRIFTISLIAVGFSAVFVLVAVLTAQLASGELGRALLRRSVRRRMDNLRNHFIVCSYGRVGRAAVNELRGQGAEVAVIEIDPTLEPALAEAGLPHLIDDPAHEAVLERAGVRRARGLLCAVDSDAVNVFITLTARSMNPELFIIARASHPESVDTLQRAGSNRVVTPYTESGVRMAALALRPALLEFVDMVSVDPDLRIEELVVGDSSPLVEKTVRQACSAHAGVMAMAVRKPSGELFVPPQADTVLSAGDLMILVGPVRALGRLAEEAS